MESDEGGYRCVVTDIAGMDASNNAILRGKNPNKTYIIVGFYALMHGTFLFSTHSKYNVWSSNNNYYCAHHD